MKLRNYQREAADDTYKFWREHDGNPVVVLPTGTGKTILFATIIKELDEKKPNLRVLLLAHRAELLTQAEDKLLAVYPEADIGVYCAGVGRKELGHNITIASRDSIHNKLAELGKIDLLIIDEAHRINNKDEGRYRKIIDALREENSDLGVLGVTATPFRAQKSDGNSYIYGDNRIFSAPSFERNIKWFIDNDYLCKMSAPRTSVEIDTSEIRIVAGDFNKKQLASAAEAEVERCCADMAKHINETNRKAVISFCASVLHAQMVAETMTNQHGIITKVIHGKLNQEDRNEVLQQLETGEIQGVANVGVLTEGWDAPHVDCISLLRPTKSLQLFLQMIGRGTRIHDGKEYCLVLDYGGCMDRFGPIDVARPTERKPDERTKDCPRCTEINSFFARKCSNCEYRFEEDPMKECGYCETPNPPSAVKCIACGEIFPRDLAPKSASNKLFSTERDLRWMNVESVRMEVKRSRKTGCDYVNIIFYCGPFNQFSTAMCIGYLGYAGKMAVQLAARFAPSLTDRIPDDWVEEWKLLPPEKKECPLAIEVDFNSNWNDIKRYRF